MSRPNATPRRGRRVALLAVGALLLVAVAVPVAGGAVAEATGAHLHGTLDIVVDGETVDLDQPRFHDLHPRFHVHEGHGNLWHHHPASPLGFAGFEPKTLREALAAMGAELSDDVFAFDGATYDRTAEDTTVTVEVDGDEVDPDDHQIADGDDITVTVETGR